MRRFQGFTTGEETEDTRPSTDEKSNEKTQKVDPNASKSNTVPAIPITKTKHDPEFLTQIQKELDNIRKKSTSEKLLGYLGDILSSFFK